MGINVNAEKDIRAFFGTSGSGKSHAIKETIKKENRVLIFDPEGEYQAEGFKPFERVGDFAKAVASNPDKMRYTLEANGQAAFDMYCRIVWQSLQDRPCVCVVDELAGVTTSAKAPPAWHTLLTRGRKYGLKVRAGAQSPTEIDKTLLRQRSHLWIGHMTRRDDFVYMAKETGLDSSVFEALRPNPFFDSVMHMHGKPAAINKAKKPAK